MQLFCWRKALAFVCLLGVSFPSFALNFIEGKFNNSGGITSLDSVNTVALSPDGTYLYVAAAGTSNAITVFSRDSASGKLTFVQSVTNSTMGGTGLTNVTNIAIAPDGKHLYATSRGDNAVVVFTRNASTGQLSLVEIQKDGAGGVNYLGGASAVAISPDNVRVYVTAATDNALTVFARNTDTGALTLLSSQVEGQNGVTGLSGAVGLTINSTGNFIYVAAAGSQAISAFIRAPAVGELGFLKVYKEGVDSVAGLKGVYNVVLSPNGAQLYGAGSDSAAISVFNVASSGELTYVTHYKNGQVVGSTTISGLSGVRDLIVLPNASMLYATAVNDNSIVVFQRDSSNGLLTFQQKLANNSSNGGVTVTSLSGVTAIDVSPDSQHLYTGALFSDAVSVFSALSTDLQLSVVDNAPVAINSPLEYTFTVTNAGNITASSPSFSQTLPTGVIFTSAVATNGACTYDSATHKVSCSMSDLASKATATITVKVTTPSSVGTGSLSSTATASTTTPDDTPSNNSVTKQSSLVSAIASADLQLTATASANPVNVNSDLTYTLTVTNNGADAASAVILTNTLPTGMVYQSSSSDSRCAVSPSNTRQIICSAATLAANASSAFNIIVTTPSAASTVPLTLSSSVTAKERDLVSSNNSASVSVSVEVLAFDLAITEALADPSSARVGTLVTYKVKLANQGTSPASGVILSSTLPSQLQYQSDNAGCQYASAKLTCNLGMLDALATPSTYVEIKALTVLPDLNISTQFTATASGTDTNQTNNNSLVIVSATGYAADINVKITASASPVVINENLTYTIVVTNSGPSDARGVTLTTALSGTSVNIVTQMNGGAAGTCSTGAVATCQFDTIKAGSSVNLALVVTPTALGTLRLSAATTIAAGTIEPTYDPNTANNSAVLETAVAATSADLSVTLSSTPVTALVGGQLIYLATIKNEGPSRVNGITFTQALPIGAQFTATTTPTSNPQPSQGNACTNTVSNGVTTISCELGPIENGKSATVTTIVTPQQEGELSTTATVTATGAAADPVISNNTVTLKTTASTSKADLTLTMAGSPTSILVDNSLTYTMTLKNSGPQDATHVILTDTLPANTVYLESALSPSSLGSCTYAAAAIAGAGGTLTCTLNALAVSTATASNTATITLKIRPDVAGEITNTAQVKGNENDPKETDNIATVKTTVTNPATLSFVEALRNANNGVLGIQRPTDLVLSPDGNFVYVSASGTNSVAVFNRNASSGKLSYSSLVANGTNNVTGIISANSLAISPDGKNIYVIGLDGNSNSTVTAFNRDSITGALTYLATYSNNNGTITGLGGAYALAATNGQVYVVSLTDKALVTFSRDSNTGTLSFVAKQTDSNFDGTNDIVISPDERHVVVANANTKTLSVFSRDSLGTLTLAQTVTGTTVNSINSLDTVNGLGFSSDGTTLYATSSGLANAVALYQRNVSTGQLQFVNLWQDGQVISTTTTVNGTPQTTSKTIDGLGGAGDVVVSPTGDYVYVAGQNDNAVAVFKRANDGQLTYIDQRRDSVDGTDGLAAVRNLAISASGIHIYAVGFNDNAVAVLRIASADLSIVANASSNPINLGSDLSYVITVTNNPDSDQATDVSLTLTFPSQLQFVSISSSRASDSCGSATTTASGLQVVCQLGTLAAAEAVTVRLNVRPTAIGEFTLSAQTLLPNQLDPTPSDADDKVSVTTKVTATTDLSVSATASPSVAALNNPVVYALTLTNNGGAAAINAVTVLPLTSTLTYKGACTGTSSCTPTLTPSTTSGQAYCVLENVNTNQVVCTMPSIAAAGSSTLYLTVVPSELGTLINTFSLSKVDTFDPNTSNNSATLTVPVRLNVIEDTRDNSGQTLSNYSIASTGAIRGGSVAGIIQNEGLLYNLTILANAQVNGGKLAGTISNNGTLNTVEFLTNTTITGGVLRGIIRGFPASPATLNAVTIIEDSGETTEVSNVILGAGTQVKGAVTLTNVLIQDGVLLDSAVVLAGTTRFVNSSNIPAGVDLSNLYPTIIDPVSQSVALNLSYDIVETNSSLLSELAALLSSTQIGTDLQQLSNTGQLLFTRDKGTSNERRIVLIPWTIRQAKANESSNILFNDDGSMTFILASGRVISAQPAVEETTALRTTLQAFGLTGLTALSDGSVRLQAATSSVYFVVRPLNETLVDNSGLSGISTESGVFKQVQTLVFHFTDREGVRRIQRFNATAANTAEILNTLKAIAGFKQAVTNSDGSLSIKINELTYTVAFDLAVQKGNASSVTQFLTIPDLNSDGSNDVQIIYLNGDMQNAYISPQSLGVALQNIPDVQAANYQVSEVGYQQFLLSRSDARLLLKAVQQTQREESQSAPIMTLLANGNVEFVTNTNLYVLTVPLVQAESLLRSELSRRGFNAIEVQADGDWQAQKSAGETWWFRPQTAAIPISSGTAGLQEVSSPVQNRSRWLLTFADSSGRLYQQFIYSTAYDRAALEAFFRDALSVTTVNLNSNGTVNVETSAFKFNGWLGYEVKAATATGSLQVTATSDLNGDGLSDYTVTYANGLQQVLYQLP